MIYVSKCQQETEYSFSLNMIYKINEEIKNDTFVELSQKLKIICSSNTMDIVSDEPHFDLLTDQLNMIVVCNQSIHKS